jgi:hypothetical protein
MKKQLSTTEAQRNELPAKSTELIPLNNLLYTEFSIEELEQRLETKAWGCDVDCGTYVECPSNSCNGLVDTQ